MCTTSDVQPGGVANRTSRPRPHTNSPPPTHTHELTPAAQVVALITLEVHARDVIDRLIKAGAASPSDFEWASQLRFYWERDAGDVSVKQARMRTRSGRQRRAANGCLR